MYAMRTPLLVVALALLMVGCNQPDPRIEEHEQKIALLEQISENQEGEIQRISTDVVALKNTRAAGKLVFLTPGNEGYSIIDTDISRLTISLEDIKAYGNGSRVTLQIGNPTSAKITGLKAKMDWGRVQEDGTYDFLNTKSKSVAFEKTLMPGSWTTATVTLSEIPPTELGWLQISEMNHSGIELQASRR